MELSLFSFMTAQTQSLPNQFRMFLNTVPIFIVKLVAFIAIIGGAFNYYRGRRYG